METNKSVAPIITISQSGSIDLGKASDAGIDNVNGNDCKETTAEGNKYSSPVNGKDKENKKEDEQISVIIQNNENNTIELMGDSDGESELELDQRAVDFSNTTTNPFTKATEFVIFNATNMTVPKTADEAETINRYAIEDLQIKDELAESITAEITTNEIVENDPMDLLELNNRSESTSSIRSQEDTEDYGDDVSSIGSYSVQTGSSLPISVMDWIKNYPWLLYEERDELFGYCLYCDAKINIKSQRSVKQHGLSLYHKERCENYLAFRDEEEKNGISMKLIEIKEEFGTDSHVTALKLKRKSQSEALNNFNWRRWLEDYPWLERDTTEGTVGYCKYCLIHVNVEFSYLRDRHQEGFKHRDAEKQYEESTESKGQNKPSSGDEEKNKDFVNDNSQSKNQRWLELVENEPTMARCKICGSKLFKNNFLRHLRTNLHVHNEKVYLQSQNSMKGKDLNQEPDKNQQNWMLYKKNHPWLVSDPVDPTFAYCKYCEKRIMYGASAVKRATHENSSQHKHNENELKKRSPKELIKNKADKKHNENDTRKDNPCNDCDVQAKHNDDGEKEENENQNEENDEKSDEENNEGESDGNEDEDENEEEVDNEEDESGDDNESKKRVYKLTDEWINQYPWCKRYKKDPTNFIYCIYCKIPLSVSYSRTKHQSTSLHISAEKELLEHHEKKQKLQEAKQRNEITNLYEWAIPLKNNQSNYSCRYCRVRISKHYSKKQHASSKIHQINENIYKSNRRKSLRTDENTNTNISHQTAANKLQTFAKVVIKTPSTVTLIKQLQKKFPWLSYKRSELRSHYGHCKVCNSSLYIRSLKHVLRHSRSGRHISIIKAKKKEKVEKIEENDTNEMSKKIIGKGSEDELPTSSDTINNSSENQTKLSTSMSAAATAPAPGPGPATEATTTKTFESQKTYSYKSTIAEMKKRFSWIEKSERQNYAFCRFCNTNIPLKILFLRNHSNSQKHRHFVINYYSVDGKKFTTESLGPSNNADLDNNNSKCKAIDDDVMLVEDNNEEILISEQDENWTVKSETMDEHEELDYLLQRSFNNTINTSNLQRNVRRSVNAEDGPPTKRIKHSQSFRLLNDSNTSLVASLLTTPLTLASCLGPLIQQQIQQHTNILQTPETNSNAPEAPTTRTATEAVCENSYDLFFKSISETMKKLPLDLAAEGKLRVMQIICDLELQALRRKQSVQSELGASNISSGLSNQATSTSTSVLPGCNSSIINETSIEQNGVCNENNTQLNINTDVSQPSNTPFLPPKVTSSAENTDNSNASSPIIGVMDKNGLQTLHFKSSVNKQIPSNTSNTAITTAASSGIRCIPFKNLSQPATPDTSSTKITRIQVPISTPTQTTNSPANTVNTSKNLISFRNIQITKRLSTTPTPAPSVSGPQANVHQTSALTNKSPQRTFITNIQPQLQRWGCSVNGPTSHHVPTSSAVNQLQQPTAKVSKK